MRITNIRRVTLALAAILLLPGAAHAQFTRLHTDVVTISVGTPVAGGGYVVLIEAAGSGETLRVMRRRVAVVR